MISSNKKGATSSESSSKNRRQKSKHDQILEQETRMYEEMFKDCEKKKLCFEVVNGDLFSVDEDVSLAHCVSQDLKMGKGIAIQFKKKFGHLEELAEQGRTRGGCAFIKHNARYVFYLVTKEFYYSYPLYSDVEKSLKRMARLCQENEVKKVAMPRIGCGLDMLKWNIVARIIDKVFDNSGISVSIYSYDKSADKVKEKPKSDEKTSSIERFLVSKKRKRSPSPVSRRNRIISPSK